jgi:hypothetical protein
MKRTVHDCMCACVFFWGGSSLPLIKVNPPSLLNKVSMMIFFHQSNQFAWQGKSEAYRRLAQHSHHLFTTKVGILDSKQRNLHTLDQTFFSLRRRDLELILQLLTFLSPTESEIHIPYKHDSQPPYSPCPHYTISPQKIFTAFVN